MQTLNINLCILPPLHSWSPQLLMDPKDLKGPSIQLILCFSLILKYKYTTFALILFRPYKAKLTLQLFLYTSSSLDDKSIYSPPKWLSPWYTIWIQVWDQLRFIMIIAANCDTPFDYKFETFPNPCLLLKSLQSIRDLDLGIFLHE